MKQKRAPKHMGTGIYVHQQFRPEQLVKGDTFFDADFGDMIWNGSEWVSETGNLYKIAHANDVWIGNIIYCELTGLIFEVTKYTLDGWRDAVSKNILTLYKFKI